MKIKRAWAMPNSKTFKIKPIKELIKKYAVRNDLFNEEMIIVDPFANEMSIKDMLPKNANIKYVSNDLDMYYETDYHLDATEFLKQVEDNSVDLLLYDPPYSPRQVSEQYKKLHQTVNMTTTQSSYWGNQKKEISRIMKKGGAVITFGWNSGGIGKSNGFEISEILMVAHGGWHNDTICTVDVKL